ncbi:integrase core domain-containing protein [Streptomyces graminofaciens]|uniref:integrase core domain-containing protein n=1 Tax=Streptomyces graminofaciens TaxID=68212 RepID=UPI003D9BDAE0
MRRLLEPKQYTSFRLAEHLNAAQIAASIGSVGDAYDNALTESTIGLFKTEVIKPQRPWKTLSHVELATAEWGDWCNHRRLHGETSRPSNTKPTTTEQPRTPIS